MTFITFLNNNINYYYFITFNLIITLNLGNSMVIACTNSEFLVNNSKSIDNLWFLVYYNVVLVRNTENFIYLINDYKSLNDI